MPFRTRSAARRRSRWLAAPLLALFMAAAQAAAPYALPPLPYPEDALEPVIDAETMRIHHGRHHRAYVDNLNAKVAEFPDLARLPLEQVMAQVSRYDAAVRNNGGGHYNHSLFWTLLAPAGEGGEPSPELRDALAGAFGSHDAFVERFDRAGAGLFGSGWVWLIVRADGSLAITTTVNQDNPLMDVVDERGLPVLALDVWEHAYYLQYRNRRADYLRNWWQRVNWHEANRLYREATRADPPAQPSTGG